jgi:hypothetical protein
VANERDHERREQASTIGVVTGFAWSIVVTLLVLIGGGIFLDTQFGTTPLLTLVGIALALLAAGYQLYELTLLGRKDREAGPIGRRLERRVTSRAGDRARR